MRNLYTQIVLAAVLASGNARNITLERRSSVEIAGVTHEVAASVAIPIDDLEDPEVAPESSSQETSTTTTTLTDNHAMVFSSEYERGVCQNIIYDHEEIMTDIGREVRETPRACYDGCASQGGRIINIHSILDATTPMRGYITQYPVFDEYPCFFEEPHFDADRYVVRTLDPLETGDTELATKVIDFDCYMSGGGILPDTTSGNFICAHGHDFPCNF